MKLKDFAQNIKFKNQTGHTVIEAWIVTVDVRLVCRFVFAILWRQQCHSGICRRTAGYFAWFIYVEQQADGNY